MTERLATIDVPLIHPCYQGHFPGRPVLPGVVLLELIVQCVGRGPPRAIPVVKFQRALSPGEAFTLRWNDAGERVTFNCDIGGDAVAEGSLTFGAVA
jgi:3-hydroxymyristoyl/3-hydroxydecanoyl-(acyl carrier protein) dehydratase